MVVRDFSLTGGMRDGILAKNLGDSEKQEKEDNGSECSDQEQRLTAQLLCSSGVLA